MATNQLLVDEGRVFLNELKKEVRDLSFLVWYTDPSSMQEYLAVGSSTFDTIGPKKSYDTILEVLSKVKPTTHALKSDFIKVTSLKSEIGKNFSEAFSKSKGDSIVGLYVTPSIMLNNIYAYSMVA